MVQEQQLIEKKFYETLLPAGQETFPIQYLGEAYLEEQHKENPDLSEIRYAQGEVYYHFKDFEAAVFKWGSIEGDLGLWAKKNSADAYYELGMRSTAEELYKSINTEEMVLRTEVLLQLFSLYIEEERFDLSTKTIKEAVGLNPDYPNVMEIAKTFFESRSDWPNAVELAANEAIRTKSLYWFDVLHEYIEQGHTAGMSPDYFPGVLDALYNTDKKRFEKMALSLWNVYQKQGKSIYFSWLNEINSFMKSGERSSEDVWPGLYEAYKNAYLSLLDGSTFVSELNAVIPDTLVNWLKTADERQILYPASAITAWNEVFPDRLNLLAVQDARTRLEEASVRMEAFEDSASLYTRIAGWADAQGLQISEKSSWVVSRVMDKDTRNILVAGMESAGGASFINGLAGEPVIEDGNASFAVIRHGEEPGILEIKDDEIVPALTLDELKERGGRDSSVFEIRFPSVFLDEQRLSFISTPPIAENAGIRNNFMAMARMADCLLVTLNAHAPFTPREKDWVLDVHSRMPHLPIHFILAGQERIFNEHDAIRLFDETVDRVREALPNANVYVYSAGKSSAKEAADFIWRSLDHDRAEWSRTNSLLYFIRKTISALLDKREEIERSYEESIRWNEDLVVKLNGAINQIHDMEKEKMKIITGAFRMNKEDVQSDLKTRIPELLRDCAALLKEDSDFRRVHLVLNQEMNRRIQDYVNHRVLPKFHEDLKAWIEGSKQEFEESQFQLSEMADGFNTLYGEEHIVLDCDFRVLDDWIRDADRMTSMVQIDDVNILLRHTPSQLLLKGAGKLFGGMGQNKAALYTRYKKYLETMDYDDTAELIISKFLSQFELFERSLERDISLFFRQPFAVMNSAVTEAHTHIENSQASLDKMRERPEVYRDPLALFKIRARQYEMLIDQSYQTIR